MAAEWENFLERAKLVSLKQVLIQLQLPTTGVKNALKARIMEAVKDFTEVQLLALIPVESVKTRNSTQNGDEDDTEEDEQYDDDDDDDDDDDEDGNNHVASGSNMLQGNLDNNNLDVELENLRNIVAKKKEIAKLKKELSKLQLEDIQITSRSPGYTFKDLEDAVPEFNGDDNFPIHRWIELFEESLEVMEFDSRTKFIFAKRLLSGTAKIHSNFKFEIMERSEICIKK